MRIGVAVREVHRSESGLAGELRRMADRYRDEVEIHHVAQDLARWSDEHVRELAAAAARHGEHVEGADGSPREAFGPAPDGGGLLGAGSDPGLALLADLRRLYLAAAGVSVDWELLGQGAQAVKDADLLALCGRCHPQTLRQMSWANGQLKVLSPQVWAR
ncbi:hypothetical protein DFP74_4424 [Nocardiopsis sp. Huas11]|uniref:hypothetical protein n=1 Tax=Nocardiopsis sp. Huas11 TaxID=2183912 RepID=UPI000EB261A5|nr:hypothetical protein [Nocardiopsis sp. Huas11]RKS08705.1 hypothetical protein DFP74_4424 [Nocardiopsis sp. Huas11]